MRASLLFSLYVMVLTVSAQQQQRNRNAELPWRPSQNQTMRSRNSVFSAGFTPLPGSQVLFRFAVWYNNIPNNSVVWYASKTPVSIFGGLSVSPSGDLHLGNSSTSPNLWPGRASAASNLTTLVLGNEGNLVFGGWQSFDHPKDTFLPNQTLADRMLTSENGRYSFRNGTDLLFNSSDRYWWSTEGLAMLDGVGKLELRNGMSLVTADFGQRVQRRLKLDDDGNLRIYGYEEEVREWSVVWHATHELCTIHGTCGPNAICTGDGSGPTTCVCPPGFSAATARGGARGGCRADVAMRGASRFVRLDYVNFTGTREVSLEGKNLVECESNCTRRAACLGFMFQYDGRGRCSIKLGGLRNGYWSPGTQSVMFLRVAASAPPTPSTFKGMTEVLETTCPVKIELPLPPKHSNTTARNVAIICTLFAAELISGAFFFWAFLKKYIKYRDMAQTLGLELLPAGGPKRFSYAELKTATGNFSELVGRGGFGDVFKGELTDRRVVAVKCLKNVAGGEPDFWAEVTIIARMHHLNLVRLWGFCAEKGERILVYEYVPNGSLDRFLFGSDGRVLDWGVRYRIAVGVARAMAYLHEECLEWVLHCDIKPENILLGDDFCPKISDFGLSKLRKKEDMVSLSKIRGTRGYMAPEWVKSDTITAKADVYSFGMVLLELVSGVRNTQAQGGATEVESENWYFPAWAFDKVYKEVSVEDILDAHIKASYDSRAHFDSINRMVKTAMWCLQSRPENRPSMGKVAKMLEGSVEITQPNKPTIFFLGDD